MARHGMAGRGKTRQGLFGFIHGMAWQGMAGPGVAWRGKARRGQGGLGVARQARHGEARRG